MPLCCDRPATGNWARLAALVEDARREAQDDGKLFLVDITADWCITCKANKQFVFKGTGGGMLAKLLDDRRLVMLQADWTRSDPRISAFLSTISALAFRLTLSMDQQRHALFLANY